MELIPKLVFTNNIYLYLLAFLLLPILLFYKAKVFTNKTYNEEFLSKPTTDSMKGMCILVVIVHHISLVMEKPILMLPFTCFGYLAVSIFFFLSGYGLTLSAINKSNYLKGFFTKRLSKVYIPFAIINILTFGLTLLKNAKYSVGETVLYFLGIKLIDSTLWFVQTIILFYIIFYFAFRFLPKVMAPHALLLFSFLYFIVCWKIGLGGWIYNTAFCLPVGVYVAIYYEKFYSFITKNDHSIFSISLISFIFTFFLGNLIWSNYMVIFAAISSICFIFLTLSISLKMKVNSRPLRFIGDISYEMYLVHMKVFIIYFAVAKLSGSYSIYIYLGLVILIGLLFNKFFSKISSIVNKTQVTVHNVI